MVQKMTIWQIVRRGGLLLCAVFCLTGLLACSDTDSSTPTISGVYAENITVDYDGREHTIVVVNALSTDTIIYWTDDTSYTDIAPSFSDVGEHIIYFKVTRSGCKDFYSSATVTILSIVLSGISAQDVSVVYDGLPHTINVTGALSSDFISYSLDGITFSDQPPSLTEPGEYQVFYRVERSYGDYRSSCVVTIYPNVFGRYFNPSYGVVVLSEDNVTFDGFDGAGYIVGDRFSVTYNTLSYKGLSFTRLAESDCVYRLIATDAEMYFVAQDSGTINITFSDGNAVIRIDEQTLLSVPNYNYCESGEIIDYIDLRFEQTFVMLSDVTDVTVTLSARDHNQINFADVYVIYDGLPHGFDISDTVILLGDKIEFTDVGRHTVTAVFLSDEYLPCILDISLIILPDLSGMYISSHHVIQISGEYLSFDGEEQRELSVDNDNWTYNGMPISVTDEGIDYAEESYTQTEDRVLMVRVEETLYLATFRVNVDQIVVTYNESKLTFATDSDVLLTIAINSDTVSVIIGSKLLFTFSEINNCFIIGKADLNADLIIIELRSEE